jgi:membrane protein YqaA with SNARE-associated domain
MTNTETSNPASSEIMPRQASHGSVPWWHWHRRLYDWVIHFAHTKHGPTALFALSFAESSFFPVPPDVLLAPLALGAPKKWLRFALACSIASVLGGIFGYCIGMFLWDVIGPWVYAHLGGIGLTEENFAKFQNWYDKYDFWIVFLCGFTPLPYKV